MAWLAIAAPIAATVLGAAGRYQAGRAEEANAEFQASQLEANASTARGMAQRRAAEEHRQERLAQSRLRALAQGGSTDPTVVNLSADLAGEGEYRALTALYEGEERARGMETQATARRWEGKQAKRAGTIGAVTSVVGGLGGSSLFDKYKG